MVWLVRGVPGLAVETQRISSTVCTQPSAQNSAINNFAIEVKISFCVWDIEDFNEEKDLCVNKDIKNSREIFKGETPIDVGAINLA